jgi:protein-disulfide isomerase
VKRFFLSARTLAPGLVVLAFLGSCRRSPGPAAAAVASRQDSPAAGSDTVAEVDGAPITLGDVDKKAASRLQGLRQEEYEIRRQALDELIAERLVAKEAKARGISPEDLLKDEVDRQVAAPTERDVEAIYERNRARLGNRTLDEVRPQIEKMLGDGARALRRQAFERQLREKARIQIALAAPRSEVALPASAPVLGPADAPVKIVEFSDYQCPFCRRAEPTVEEVLARYAGKVQLVHRDFPLDGHARAFPAARAARCAGEQGRFWDYHRNLLNTSGDLSDTDLQARAASLKLEPNAFAACLASDRHDAEIREAVQAGAKAGVTGTPTFFINGQLLNGAQPFGRFQEIIDAELARGG